MSFDGALASLQRFPIMSPGVVRLLLAAIVVLSHITRFDVGRIAVLVFFFLSGYWTAKIWEEKFNSSNRFKFYLARYLRIAPLYFLAVVSAGFLRGIPMHPENFTLIGVASTLRDPTQVSWSLDLELQFYLLLPLVVAAARRIGAWPLLAASMVVAVGGIALEVQLGVVTVAKYLPAFVLGVLTHTTAWRPRPETAALSIVGFAAATVATAYTPFISKDVADPFDRDVFAFFWMLPFLPYVAASLWQRSSSLDRHLGNLSYPIYLLHFPVLALSIYHVGDTFWHKLLIATGACLLACVVYWFFDRPVDRWRVRLTESDLNGRRPDAGAVT